MVCVEKIPVAKKFMDKTEGSIKIFRQNFLSHSAENVRRGILQCFINFRYRKILGITEGGGD